jgi:hypothetical protein
VRHVARVESFDKCVKYLKFVVEMPDDSDSFEDLGFRGKVIFKIYP